MKRILSYLLAFFGTVVLLVISSCTSQGGGKDDDDTIIHHTAYQKYAGSGEIKLMSFNVRCVNTKDGINAWDNRRAACIDMIKDQKPTIIGFQEAVYDTQWFYLKMQMSTDYTGYGVGRNDGKETGECMGILYRTAEVEKISGGTFWLSETPDLPSKGWGSSYYRTCTWGIFKMKATGQQFCFFNTHLDIVNNGVDVRSKEMELIMKKFAELNPNGYPQFLQGDLNTESGNSIFDELRKTMALSRDEAVTTDNNNTFNGFGSGVGIIDHIWYTKSLKAIEYHTVNESYGSVSYLSDHYPIYSIIKF